MATFSAHVRSVSPKEKRNGRTARSTRRKRFPDAARRVSPRRRAREETFSKRFLTRPNRSFSRSRPPRRFARAARPAASRAGATRSRARPRRRPGASGSVSMFPRRREKKRAPELRSVHGTIRRRRRTSSSRPSSRGSRRFPRSRGSPDAAEARVGALSCPRARAHLPSPSLRARREGRRRRERWREAKKSPKKKRAVDRSRRVFHGRRFPAAAKDHSARARRRVSQGVSASRGSEKARHDRHAR